MSEFIIIVESKADFTTATDITKRVVCERIEWIEDYYEATVQWSGLESETAFSTWRDIGTIRNAAESSGMRRYRPLRGRRLIGSDGAVARIIFHMLDQYAKERDISAIILIRDLDNQPDRKNKLIQARDEQIQRRQTPSTIVLGLANCKREAWVLNGFLPQNAEEESVMDELTSQLNFDPTTDAHRLRATTDKEPNRIRNAKVVLGQLTNNDHERERQCWQETELEVLRARGTETGLTDFMTEVEERLVPLF